MTIQVEALASLEITAPFAYQILGAEHILDLKALLPGPLDLVLLRDDGRRYGLTLHLEPGAKRVVQIR